MRAKRAKQQPDVKTDGELTPPPNVPPFDPDLRKTPEKMVPERMNATGEKWQMQPSKTVLQKVWVWGDTVAEFVKSRITGYSLCICAGGNPCCDVNIDLDPADRSIIRGDMRLLMYPPDMFDTVVSDPPWKIGYYERFRPFFEAVRVCKVGGRIIYNATWIPMTPSADVELEEVWVRQDKNYCNVSVICVFRKVKGNAAYEAHIEGEQNAVLWAQEHPAEEHKD